MDDIVEFSGEIRFVPVREVPAVREVHGEDAVADIERCEINGCVGLAAAMRLHVGVFRTEEFLGALDGQRFDDIDMLASAIPAPARITFGIFVGQRGSLRLPHGAAGEILRGDQFDILELAALLVMDGGGDGGIGFLDLADFGCGG